MTMEGRPNFDAAPTSFTRIEFNNPDDQREVDYGNEPDDEEYDFSDGEYDPYDEPGLIDSFEDQYDSDQEPGVGERLGYQPFIASHELAIARHNAIISSTEVRQRLGEMRSQLVEQQTGIAKLLQDLHTQLQADPDITPIDLLDAAAVKLRFTDVQYNRLSRGLESFARDRVNAKALYEAHHGDASAIFTVCFRRPPQGQVDVQLTGANLNFQCFELQDYVFASTANIHHGDATKITQDHHDYAEKSAGVATRVAAPTNTEPNLDYSVTLENLIHNHRTETRVVTETNSHKLVDGDYHGSFRIGSLHHLVIESGQHHWDITVIDHGRQLHLRHQFEGQTRGDGRYGGYRRSDRPDEPIDYTYQEMLDFAPGRGHQSQLHIDEYGVTYTDHRPEGATITASEENYRTVSVINDPHFSQLVQAHESQHRFNDYFKPYEEYPFPRSRQIATLRQQEHAPDPEATKQRLLFDEARNLRRQYVDNRARDEVLAYFQEGRAPDQIFSTLATSPLYDYRHQAYTVDKVKVWQDYLQTTWQDTFMLATYADPSDFPTTTSPLTLTDAEFQTAIDQVFGPEYQEQLHKWTDVLLELQASGYDSEEIIALLYQEPVNHWVAFASLIEPDLRSKVQQRARDRALARQSP